MPRLRSNKKSARYDPLFGPAQDGNTAPGYNVPRGITFEELRELTNRARQSGGSPISVKNQIRAVVAAAGLTSAAAGALTLRAYQYVDQTFGKRPRGSDASETNAEHSRLRGVKEPRTIDPELPSYEEVSSREDEFVEETGEKFGDAVETAFTVEDDDDAMQQIAREEQKEADLQGIRNVLLSMHGDTGDFVVDASDQNRESFDNLPSGNQVEEPFEYNPEEMPNRVEDDNDVVMDNNNNNSASEATSMNAVALIGNQRRTNANQMTLPRQMRASNPFHNTTEAILEYHGSCSVNDLPRTGSTQTVIFIRMNTPLQPFAETPGSAVNQISFEQPTRGISFQTVGKYAHCLGTAGALFDRNYHRTVSAMDDPLFAAIGTPFTGQKCAGIDWYNNHYGAYTVTKCEWTLYVEFPWNLAPSNMIITDSPTSAQVQSQLCLTAPTENQPFFPGRPRVFTHYRTSGDTIPAINPPISADTLTMERWFNVFDNKVNIPANGAKAIKGTWYPGKVKHNPVNDGDIEIWTPVGNVPTTGHLEHLAIQCCEPANSGLQAATKLCVNMHINLKYYVQFKEPKTEMQYPVRGQANPAGTVVNSLLLQSEPVYNV